MKAIHKFELRVDITGTSCESLIIDHAAKVIHVGEQDGNIFIWGCIYSVGGLCLIRSK